jgi:hypothetical protein
MSSSLKKERPEQMPFLFHYRLSPLHSLLCSDSSAHSIHVSNVQQPVPEYIL